MRISEKRLTELAEAAFAKAAEQVVKVAKDTGTPVIWKNGKMTAVPPERIRLKSRSRKPKK